MVVLKSFEDEEANNGGFKMPLDGVCLVEASSEKTPLNTLAISFNNRFVQYCASSSVKLNDVAAEEVFKAEEELKEKEVSPPVG